MRLPTILSSTILVATAILGLNSHVNAQCQGGYCPIPSPYYDQNAPSKYGYTHTPNSQGNQNPNWQGNQSPDWRNDNGWRGGNNNQQSYYQGNNNSYYRNNAANYDNNASWNARTNNSNYNQTNADQTSYLNSGNAQGYFSRNPNENPANKNTSDGILQQKVNDAIKNNYLKKNYKTVNARVYNGNVTLNGTVETEEDRQEVENRIRSLGVNNINDQLQVSSAYSGPSESKDISDREDETSPQTANVSDEDLQKQAEDTLKNNYVKKNYDTILVTVSNGVITITGIVDSDKDREEIRQRLQKLRGIRNIDDRVQVTGSKTSFNYKKPSYLR